MADIIIICNLHLWILGPGLFTLTFMAIHLSAQGQAFELGNKEAKVSITESNLRRKHYPGELIFSDEFDTLDLETWFHDNTFGGSTWPFHANTNSRTISYAKNGTLFIKPTLTSEIFGAGFLYNGQWAIEGPYPIDMCTDPTNYGCKRSGHYPYIVNPVISAQLRTVESFYFKYGRVVIRAKLPAGDWMWPAIVMQPRFNTYGGWPASGDFRIVESRGNQLYFDSWGNNFGSERITAGIHVGPHWMVDRFDWFTQPKWTTSGLGFDRDFHTYELRWTDEVIEFSIDGVLLRDIRPPSGGFWEFGQFDSTPYENPWKHAQNKVMAPFDQKFYLTINVIVGGKYYFPDHYMNKKGKKPWEDESESAFLHFFEGRNDWFPTWAGDAGAFQIDYVRVYAI